MKNYNSQRDLTNIFLIQGKNVSKGKKLKKRLLNYSERLSYFGRNKQFIEKKEMKITL